MTNFVKTEWRTMNKDENTIVKMKAVPIEGTSNARLIGFDKIQLSGVFLEIGTYTGHDYHYTPNTLIIDRTIIDDKEYIITEIQSCSFSHCSDVECIIIGACVERIDWNMYKCSKLQSIIVKDENKVYHDIDGVLFKGNELIAFPQGRIGSYIVPYGTKSIGNHAFKSAKIEHIVLPNTLEEIGDNAFYECHNLKEIVLPQSIKRVKANYNVNRRPIQQRFYLSNDCDKNNPYSIIDITKIFPA